jgi:hypothetical protein
MRKLSFEAARFLAIGFLASACGASGPSMNGGENGGGGHTGTTDPGLLSVFAHSADQLFKVDPDTLNVTLVGSFSFAGASDSITDIALDKTGRMIGISFYAVYQIDKTSAACTQLGTLDHEFNGLSFVSASSPDGNAPEVLIAAALDGTVYRIDPTTGATSSVGNYGNGMASSGDIVSVAGFGTVATVTMPDAANDWLVKLDPTTGVATTIGDTGFSGIWGIGYWKSQVYGFTQAGEFILIDPKTGQGTLINTSMPSWWGAGVTTSAPVVP